MTREHSEQREADTLEKKVKALDAECSSHESMAEALTAAQEWAGENDRVLFTGSFHIVEEAMSKSEL